MIIESTNCFNCSNRIINPVCMECRIKELESWLNDQKIQIELQKEIIDKAKAIFPKEHFNIHSCIFCNNNVMICMPCFFSKLDEELQKIDLPQETKESFAKTFNYQIYLRDLME